MRMGLILCLLFTSLPSLGQEVLHIRSLDAVTNLNPYLSYYLDEDKSKDINDISALSSGYFVSMDKERSEEHTSELQSLTNLVCRLLLEKKNNN